MDSQMLKVADEHSSQVKTAKSDIFNNYLNKQKTANKKKKPAAQPKKKQAKKVIKDDTDFLNPSVRKKKTLKHFKSDFMDKE